MLHEEAVRIGQRVTHLRAVLNSMRAYTEQPTLQFTPEVLRELLEEAAALTRTTGRNGGGPSINIQVPPDMIVEVSRTRLIQALTNMLENAIESYDGLESRKPIEVRADAQEGRVTLIIEDSGCGMSAEALADSVTLFATSKPNGTGFGLPLAVKIVESEHGGRVELQSRAGPRHDRSHHNADTSIATMAGNHKVLIVEDDKATAEDLAEVLRSIGCDCRGGGELPGGLARSADRHAFCLILLDLQIKSAPDAIKGHVEHGKALLREIRQMHGDHSGLPYLVAGVDRERICERSARGRGGDERRCERRDPEAAQQPRDF